MLRAAIARDYKAAPNGYNDYPVESEEGSDQVRVRGESSK